MTIPGWPVNYVRTPAGFGCVSLALWFLFVTSSIASSNQNAQIAKLEGHWFRHPTVGCFFNQRVLAIKGNEILIHIRQTERLLATIKHIVVDGSDLLVSYELPSPKGQLGEIRLRPNRDGFFLVSAKSNGKPVDLDEKAKELWALNRCPEVSSFDWVWSYFFASDSPYDPQGPRKRLKNQSNQ
jgi:hypothetical protein